jgi:glycosyltransferase involved in cell wall biosynthesis
VKILHVHNAYLRRGGEDVVFTAESALLRSYGHDVVTYEERNDGIADMSRLRVALAAVWSSASLGRLSDVLVRSQPEVCHFHNTFPLISPSAYYACVAAGVPVVQTLHNYRLMCPAATFFRARRPCEDCVGTFTAWPGVVHACYRDSRTASAAVAAMLATHRVLGTWTRCIDAYVAPTEFSRRKYIEGGLPADRIVVKPNFLPDDPGLGGHAGGYALFVGRLSPEKGLQLVLDVWRSSRKPPCPLKIVGSGPLEPLMRSVPAGVEWLGEQSHERVLALMKDALFLVFPSEWYETFGLTIVEAFATGLPVIASKRGAAGELVSDGATGLQFVAGSSDDLAARANWAATHAHLLADMGRRAREEYERKYTAARNYPQLIDVYETAVQSRRRRLRAH